MEKGATQLLKKSRNALLLAGVLALVLAWVSPFHAFAGDFELGIKAYHAQSYPLAIRFFRQAAKNDRNNANIHYYLADSLVKLKRYREAQIEYQKILALAPSSQAARFSRVSLGKLRKLEESRYRIKGKETTTHRITGQRVDKFDNIIDKGDDYLNDITDSGRRVRWSTLKMPLKLYVEESPVGIRNFQRNFVSSIPKALDVWVQALKGKLSYVMINRPEEADIKITWVNTLDTEGQTSEEGTTFHAGITVPQIKFDQLMGMEIKMATFDIRKKPQKGENIFAIAIHEMGHALGLLGHSENPKDIMFPQNRLVYKLSTRDRITIQKLYGEMADITNLPASTKVDPEREAELAKRLDEQIERDEQKNKEKNDSLTWLNLGTTYFSKGKSLAKRTKTVNDPIERKALEEEAQEWFDKAIETIGKSIQLEPRSALAYYNRSVVLQEFNAIEPALDDINQAIRFDINNGSYYWEKAWILGKLKRKTEALNALDAYLIREPYKADSPDVIRIRKFLEAI